MPPEELLRLTRRAAAAGLASLAACAPTRLEPLTGPPRGRVILLRGLANVFSTGLNFLTARLRHVNFDASVHNYLEWHDLAASVAQADRAGTLARPFAIMGHSYGADDAIVMANALGRQGVVTDLLVPFDPTGGDVVGPGVRYVLNFYQNGDPTFRRTVAAGPGFTGTLENRLVNGESHLTIEKQERLHREVIALLQSLAADREARAAQLAPPSPQMPPGPPIRAGR